MADIVIDGTSRTSSSPAGTSRGISLFAVDGDAAELLLSPPV
jgi:hypothetical protein